MQEKGAVVLVTCLGLTNFILCLKDCLPFGNNSNKKRKKKKERNKRKSGNFIKGI